jgi:membrane-associated protease RseP (regulator of RpoE activity)
VAATKLPRGQQFAEQGRVDLFVAATAVWDLKPDDDRLWEPAWALGRRLIDKAELKGDRRPHNCPSSFKDYATYKRLMPPLFKRLDEPYTRPDPQEADPPVLYHQEAVQAPGVVTAKGITNNLIVSRGLVRAETIIQSSVIFANGNVTSQGHLLHSVVVCDGDVAVTDSHITGSLIVARGNITVGGNVTEATLIAGGKVTVGTPRKVPGTAPNLIKENEPNPLNFITFFELRRVGLEVNAADGAVRVSAVAAGKACEKAGVKAGDTILEVNGKKPADAEALRRLLRDALAVGDATVKLQRGNDTLTVKLALPE